MENNNQKTKRSASYPSITVQRAFDFACKINDHFSTVVEVSREEIASALNLNAGTIIRDISSCVQYDLLDKNTSEGKYKLSQIFKDIFRPESEREKKIALIKAFGSPKLYVELIEKYDNNVIPNELPNVLIRNHEIREEVASGASDIFIESGKYCGVINDNRILKYSVTLSTLEKSNYVAIVEDIPFTESSSDAKQSFMPAVKKPENNINIPIHLIGDKMAFFSYPENLSEDDVEIIKHSIDGILLRIKLSKKKDANSPQDNNND